MIAMFQRQSRHLVVTVLAFALSVTFLCIYQRSAGPPTFSTFDSDRNITKLLVVSSQKKDDTNWIQKFLPDWGYIRYVTDEPLSEYTVPKNKGNEAMVYLTYIIDHYDNLPDLVVFIHGDRFQWHVDDPLWDNAYLLSRLQIPHLLSQNYTNLRCVWTLGCPSDIKGIEQARPSYLDPNDEFLKKHHAFQFAVAFPLLFPHDPMPTHVSVPCCAQFATLSSAIRSRPLSQYVAMRRWLLDTRLESDISGRVLEFSWHILFRAPAFSCPDVKECYCKVYGDCGVRGCNGRTCGSRWDWPPSKPWPEGWPEIGWDGKVRSEADLAKVRKLGKADGPKDG